MLSNLISTIFSALASFTSATRLYALTLGDGDADSLLVEAFAADEQVHGIGARDIIALSTSARIKLASLLGKQATLHISLADGTRTQFSGWIRQAAMLGSHGGLTRYRLRLTPWLWELSQVRNSRVWQDKTVIEIIDNVFSAYAPRAIWRWSDETGSFMDGAGQRGYCCQYRESDYDFIHRLLTDEGLSWRFEEVDGGQCMVLFADSSEVCATPEDASSAQDGGLRYHAARAGEPGDTIQALRSQRSLRVSMVTVLSYDYKAKKAISASVPTNRVVGGKHAPQLESYDAPGQYRYANAAQARRYATLQMQAHEARAHLWQARSTVRTLRTGTRFTLTQGPLQQLGDEDPQYVVLRVASVGINNLPLPAVQGMAELFGPIPELLEESLPNLHAGFEDAEAAMAQAHSTGYANCFEAILAATPWRPMLDEPSERPTALGSQSAIVVGPDGGDRPNGADEIHCDRLGRVRIRFHWQEDRNASCWVRVAQRSAGGGMGSQFLPRIGQEVLVQFIENDIDRPVILGALYNGRGEGGVPATPGGVVKQGSDPSVFNPAHDHAVSGQGNLAGGNSPLWHGVAGGGHRNGAAQWGIRSKEFGGFGYNQLLFDDTDQQGRIQLKSSLAASELNLGHLIHSADNYRGSLRGAGAELRTDAYGAVRAGAGLLVTSYAVTHGAVGRDPAGDNAPGIALLKQAVILSETFSNAARTHETVAYDDQAAPLKTLLAAVSGMHDMDGSDVPHVKDPIIAVSAKAGLGLVAGQDIQLSNGETVALMSGLDSQFIGGGQWRVHTGQAIGVLGGAVQAGDHNLGLQLIAARNAIELQAQSDRMNIQARDEINVISANAHIDWAAAKSISLSTAGGANITISGGNITVQCPGKITIHAGTKAFIGPTRITYPMPVMPRSICVACLLKSLKAAPAFTSVE
ncbi:type VI secretion system Vgr family protein [Janthinobacterium agaricidamnosum]|uniref:Rhs element Vgr family protein n=1 Tax=Janthinobacterium agaricidamnosum NBRC 102515 = DSM 9628 TaxID=1349767 RepID=W0V8U3_9BURK|nr:type VI secretion system Vgr family protein [Janthinobacterium agaricidamnosum]CDG83773.1 rhs element Vgr family protein [Janthinobacterium agaricidamnosum NBRC 102515 = DSM 9628]